jgi:hypothetical protein
MAGLSLAMAAVVSTTAANRRLPADPGLMPASTPQTVVTPERRALDARPPVPAPALPPAAAHIHALTIDITTVREPASGPPVAKTIARTADRLHIRGGDAREWLFEQNPVDPRRVSGFLIDHPLRTIVLYADSDLRMLMGIRGWADVVLLGFDIDMLGRYTPTRDWQWIGGVRFTRYVGATAAPHPPQVWWSEDHLLAREVVATDPAGRIRTTILRVRAGIDRSLLEPAARRYPAYRVMSVADWLEHR